MTTIGQGRLRMQWDADWHRQCRSTPEARRVLEAAVDSAATAAKRFAPVRTGAYRDSIEGRVGQENGMWRGAVGSDDFKAVWIERGAHSPLQPTPAQHVLQRGVEAVGIRVVARV